jgi:hypothetical protein
LPYYEFHPLDESQEINVKSIRWNIDREIDIILEYLGFKNFVLQIIGQMALSHINHIHLTVGEGKEMINDSGIAFSHGRGGTPFFYTSYLMHLAGLGYRVGAVQHAKFSPTGLSTREEIKRFREG